MPQTILLFFSTYIFLLSALYFLLWSVVLFISFRKDRKVRKKILTVSLLFSIITPFIEHINLADWWSPVFLSHTFFHIEDLLFGFGITGTSLGIYFWISKNMHAQIEQQAVFSRLHKTVLLIAPMLIMFIPFYLAYIPSFYTEIMSMLVLSTWVFAKIPKMILPAIKTGVLLTLIILPGYFVATYLHPGWIQEYWKLAGWPGQLFLTVPIGEYIFYFLSGLFIPAFAEVFFTKLQK